MKLTLKKVLVASFIILLLLAFFGVTTYKTMNSRAFQLFGGIINSVNAQDKVVALTFDDGPSVKTDIILSILYSEDVKATFFLVGKEIKQYPEETKKLILSGHQIGNHTYSHKPMVFKAYSYIRNEIEATDSLIKEMGYMGTIQVRPPYSKKLLLLPYYLQKHSRKTILWDIEPNSYPEINSSSENIVKYVVDNTNPGSIILLHPMYDEKGNSINSIKGIIQGLKKKGYTFVTINELINTRK
jgi:chitin deacetylase